MQNKVKISGVVIAFNEEQHIADCVNSMLPVVDELLVVDSFSTDRTVEICKDLGVRVIEHAFEGYIQQKNYAMERAEHDIILSLDADERVSATMQEAILAVKENWLGDAYQFRRLNNYGGAWLKNSWYPDAKIRLWDRKMGKWGGENPHDKVEIPSGKVIKLKGNLLHFAYPNMEAYLRQNYRFAMIAAKAKYDKGKKANFFFHVLFNPLYKFLYLYFFRLFILDGYHGFIFAAASGYLNFMKYLRLWELNRRGEE